ncbi:hypothetical protein CEXT_203101 [Caerostris extrusa]|uniref:Secreted protein n=1 Tax=Caerostris extrusa TaxID=172846 RepID=A0AAV4XD47_CAEEX|nr:hypothetical protein CEXT_203101 [Caerostris extrusa]
MRGRRWVIVCIVRNIVVVQKMTIQCGDDETLPLLADPARLLPLSLHCRRHPFRVSQIDSECHRQIKHLYSSVRESASMFHFENL